MSFLLWGKLLLLAFSAWSVLAYYSRRSDDKVRLREVTSTHRAVRSLTPQEQAALQPLLDMPPTPGKPLVLKSTDVVRLYGPATTHSLTVQGHTTAHRAIGGVEVLLPFDAFDHLREYNEAEVVLTDRCAIVIGLNGSFDLLQARESARLKQLADQHWTQGTSGATSDEELPGCGDLRVLKQRTETDFERAAKLSKVSWGLACGLLMVGLSALMASHIDDASWFWLPGLIAAPGGLLVLHWLLTRGRQPEAGKVNCAQGSLMQVSVTAPGASVSTQRHVFGSSQAVDFPHHWLPFVQLGAAQVSMDVRLADQQVLRYRHLSLDEEQRRFPRVLWGHHLLLAVVGGLLALAAWLFSDDVLGDARVLQAWFSPTVDRADDLKVGRMVKLGVRARCALGSTVEQAVDCQRLHLQGSAHAVPIQAPKPGLVEWASGARFDEIPASGLAGGWGWGAQGLRMMASGPVVITQVPTLARDINALCEGASDAVGQTACGQLKMDLMASLQTDSDASPEQIDWPQARAWMKEQEARNVAVYAVVQRSELGEWKARTQEAADAQLRAHVLAQLKALSGKQPEGVTLQLLHASPITSEGQRNADGVHAWRALQLWAGTPLLHQVQLAGVITQGHQAAGQATWVLDTQLRPDQAWRSAMRCLLLLLALALLGWHLPAFVIGFRRDDRQLRAIVEHWTRMEGGVNNPELRSLQA